MNVWCVAYRERDGSSLAGSKQWCATFRNARPSAEAIADKTACGFFVTMRIDSAKRKPTCPDCQARVARRRKR